MLLFTEAFVFKFTKCCMCVPKCYKDIDLLKCMVIAYYLTIKIWSHAPAPIILLSAANDLLIISSSFFFFC